MIAAALTEPKCSAILHEFGSGAQTWIDGFEARVQTCVDRWHLEIIGTASAGLPINVIFFAEQAGQPVVLKIGYPHPEQVTEMIALSCYAGRNAPVLLAADRDLGAVLMERILPGTTLRESDRTIERSRIPLPLFAGISQQVGSVEGLPSFSDWLEGAFSKFRQNADAGHDYATHVDLAASLYRELAASESCDWLLHGDLHHENILVDGQRGWIAIDPKGVIGPRSMEVGRFLHNFVEDEVEGISDIGQATVDDLCPILAVRYENFSSTLGMPRPELARAAYIDCVLSLCWTLNAGMHWRDNLVRVEATRAML